MISPDLGKWEPLPEMSVSCPPALRCLVFLWEQISSNCVQVVQGNGTDADEINLKDVVLTDDNQLEEFDLRKNAPKKGM